ncbi:tuberoinfundibular peptide of 39 residues [Spea bombifrons]|uniref:tuberoinfundibular peptide of 39 residues n=1 Tax=Spea bombifrons TaxID=233779 RepID=UPI0023498086|nr:tuberoinfundibular peptide of 39 residues [Spea bombifrons]
MKNSWHPYLASESRRSGEIYIQGMERRAASRTFLPITALLGYCIVLSSAAIIPSVRNSNRLWKIDLSEQPLGNKQLGPFQPRSWKHQLPSIMLHDWSLKMLSSDLLPSESAEDRRRKLTLSPATRQILLGSDDVTRKVLPENPEMPDQRWMPMWPPNEELEKRNIVVADDAAFRERSKMLTAMERQKWLNSYMQKLLVVNST